MDSATGPPLIGESEVFRKVLRIIERVAPTDCPVLITGETGTGKELVARAIHSRSQRSNGPLVFVNCSAIPASLIESELFGYERGALTGASTSYPGKFGEAHRGSLVLDEISEFPLGPQAKLLRVLETGELQRLGGRSNIKVDVRIIATTNCDLEARVSSGLFRSDLFYRMNVIRLSLPPLRERGDDVIVLASYFLNRCRSMYDRRIQGFSASALQLLRSYSWPGNVRELEHVIERAVLLSRDGRVSANDMMLLQTDSDPPNTTLADARLSLIKRSLRRNKGNVSKSARQLGLSRKGLIYILSKNGIETSEFRGENSRRMR